MPLLIERTRSGLVESQSVVHVAVCDAAGARVAWSGDAGRVTYWRSSAKPFQAVPLVADGAADAFGLDDRALALACGSHSSEPVHIEVVDAVLARIGCTEADLACGPHTPLSPAVARVLMREGREPSPIMSNCSGKHAAMLALARHHGWPTAGYAQRGHPVQERILVEVMRFSGLAASDIHLGVDGCTAVCFALPLAGMATAYARFGTNPGRAEERLRKAMWAHPELVAGTGRLCTDLMAALPGDVLAKVGADGVYGAAIPSVGLGVALKVEDGDFTAGPVALLAVLAELFEQGLPHLAPRLAPLVAYARPPVLTTRGEPVGERRPAGRLTFA